MANRKTTTMIYRKLMIEQRTSYFLNSHHRLMDAYAAVIIPVAFW
jgi:hypothetical protein